MESRVDSHKGVVADATGTGDHDMQEGYKAMVSDRRMMSDVVAAPKNGVISYSDVGLNGVVLKHEGVFPKV